MDRHVEHIGPCMVSWGGNLSLHALFLETFLNAGNSLDIIMDKKQNIAEWFGFKGTFKGHLVQHPAMSAGIFN